MAGNINWTVQTSLKLHQFIVATLASKSSELQVYTDQGLYQSLLKEMCNSDKAIRNICRFTRTAWKRQAGRTAAETV